MQLEHRGGEIFLIPNGGEHDALRRLAGEMLRHAATTDVKLSPSEGQVLLDFLLLSSDKRPNGVTMSEQEARVFATTLDEAGIDLPEPEATMAQNAIFDMRLDLGLEI